MYLPKQQQRHPWQEVAPEVDALIRVMEHTWQAQGHTAQAA
jgi:hypothetical protein